MIEFILFFYPVTCDYEINVESLLAHSYSNVYIAVASVIWPMVNVTPAHRFKSGHQLQIREDFGLLFFVYRSVTLDYEINVESLLANSYSNAYIAVASVIWPAVIEGCTKFKLPRFWRELGAGNRNRTGTASLGSWSSATKLYLRCYLYYTPFYNKNQ